MHVTGELAPLSSRGMLIGPVTHRLAGIDWVWKICELFFFCFVFFQICFFSCSLGCFFFPRRLKVAKVLTRFLLNQKKKMTAGFSFLFSVCQPPHPSPSLKKCVIYPDTGQFMSVHLLNKYLSRCGSWRWCFLFWQRRVGIPKNWWVTLKLVSPWLLSINQVTSSGKW